MEEAELMMVMQFTQLSWRLKLVKKREYLMVDVSLLFKRVKNLVPFIYRSIVIDENHESASLTLFSVLIQVAVTMIRCG